jgi:hypothetical protein
MNRMWKTWIHKYISLRLQLVKKAMDMDQILPRIYIKRKTEWEVYFPINNENIKKEIENIM